MTHATTTQDEPAAQGGGKKQSGIGQRRSNALSQSNTAYATRRAEIIEAAAAVFIERGFSRTTLSDVAEAVGTDRATLYYYVKSKEELLDEVVTRVVVANTEAAEQIRDSEGSAPERLRRLMTDLMLSFEKHYPFIYVYLQENLAHVKENRKGWAAEMRAVNRRYEKAIASIIAQGIEEGTVRDLDDPMIMAYGLIGMLSWTNRWFSPKLGIPASSIAYTYVEMLLSGMVASDEKSTAERT
ncbi:TetR/AcrR family transcriptional regulator [Salinibacterium sp. ZJ454]|uniref:TetR/AcrR family transcriptional regulator n=1 Tax=Salinibacterium sp. ZJ454 TaxID=2708339 RepID=UPI00142376EB|nr:TetR/AcrR family transcriptional regulator [Salinibacterium sp. ZJ454]